MYERYVDQHDDGDQSPSTFTVLPSAQSVMAEL